MRKWLVFVLLLGLMVFPSTGDAQGGTKLASMHIELWAEYDQPSMLVINQFVVSQNTSLPATVTLRFPKEGNLVAVAVEKNDSPFNTDFEGPAEQGDWQTITLNVQSYDPFRIEYYQPLTREGNKRFFKYQWFGDYSVKEFGVNIQLPADSTELKTSPSLSSTGTSPDGLFILGMVTRNELKMGSSLHFELEYQRTSDSLSKPGQTNEVQPSEPIGSDTPGRVSINNLPWVIGGFGLALIGIALFTYWRSTQSSEHKPRRRRHQAEEANDKEVYCHECGARAHAGDRFCRTCGSRLRVE
jgi:hypothetical protein